MPFVSKAQHGYLYIHHPEVAKEFASKMNPGDYKKLPEHVGDKIAAMKVYADKLKGG